ncbi:NADPH-dependent 2,4-dienoyl-CoA reductase/sulfur reductase-like enzyme [Stella humosa]|uniref:NADPH-dependent 2,4-dienoyl-CoA reductase/sulfur reductase-like enzyme n=1 Tax=Stella humosa TaxID=94 RepID=A0A3N1KSF1_9PROT|nr:NAD(P)/FAD-dependent oxidoreductase [Stella humosa]ROP81320.1 NADPH-dependent 2,4-dienoyl-CoA reductase/sulfur reductase-like enzyme [Stella humosa]BBK32669.1 cytochrome c [Stella humosa]
MRPVGRRAALVATAGLLAAPFVSRRAWAQGAGGRVVVVGGGFAGATAARTLRRADPALQVTLVESGLFHTACPLSNSVIAGLREIDRQVFRYAAIAADGVAVVHGTARNVDAEARRVTLADGATLDYDRLILAPGIDIDWTGLPGYDEAAAEPMPHAWKAGPQTLLLRRQLEAMEDGGVVAMSAPANPFRCPPGPYERASLIAHYLKTRKPRSKLLLLDAKDVFSKQRLFTDAWAKLYPGIIEWVPLSKGGKVVRVDPATRTVETEFDSHKAAVVNIIPPQRAGAIAAAAGVADRTGWCPIDPASFESRLRPGIHVLGDAAIAGAMPKSAFSANAQAKVAAIAVSGLLRGRAPAEPRLINTCYSLVAPNYGISIAGVYRPRNGVLADIEGAGGTSPPDAPPEFRELEADHAETWFRTITAETFG